jgi:transcription initiation factor IIE alpha subunit
MMLAKFNTYRVSVKKHPDTLLLWPETFYAVSRANVVDQIERRGWQVRGEIKRVHDHNAEMQVYRSDPVRTWELP